MSTFCLFDAGLLIGGVFMLIKRVFPTKQRKSLNNLSYIGMGIFIISLCALLAYMLIYRVKPSGIFELSALSVSCLFGFISGLTNAYGKNRESENENKAYFIMEVSNSHGKKKKKKK